MTFGPADYVPVLKLKRGEKAALALVPSELRSRVIPILEIVERTDKDLPGHIDTAFVKLASSLHGYPRCLLDARELTDDRAASAAVFARADREGIAFTPVTGLSRQSDTAAALEHRDRGLALRLTRAELEEGELPGAIYQFMGDHSLRAEDVDLVVDLGAVDTLVTPGIMALTEAFLRMVPDHERWSTLTLSACAFPQSMGVVGRNSYELVPRAEWSAWQTGLYSRRNAIRLPTFSDGAVQHPTGVEGFDPRIMQVSASIRYTLPGEWLLIKGHSTRTSPPSVQFPALATQLVYGHLRSYFAGVDHCPACHSIKAGAEGASGFGSAEVWRRLGTAHHIVRATEELAALSWT